MTLDEWFEFVDREAARIPEGAERPLVEKVGPGGVAAD